MADQTVMLNSIALRALAEYAQSVRAPGGDPVYFVASADADGKFVINHQTENPGETAPGAAVAPVSTSTVYPGRPAVESVMINAEGLAKPEELVPTYDALFWSESAVEKFLFPYYASKHQWLAAHCLTVLSQIFYGYVPGAPRVPGTDGTAAMAGTEGDEVPFAVGHIPRSDYAAFENDGTVVEQPDAGDQGTTGGSLSAAARLGMDLAVLFRRPDGTVHHRLLAEFL